MRDPTHPTLSATQQTLNIFHMLGFISGELQNVRAGGSQGRLLQGLRDLALN